MAEKLFKRLLKKTGLYNTAASFYNRYNSMKMKRIYRKMKETGEAPMPSRFIFEPTQRCNLRCKMCFFNRDMTVKPNELTLEEIKRIFSGIKSLKFVNMIGGEVLLRRDFFDIIDFFRSRGVEIHIGTNATMVNERNIQRFKSNPNITAVTTSIDGDRELHNSIRRTDFAFDNTIKGVNMIKGNIPVYVVSVITDDNVEKLPDIVRIIANSGIKNLTFEYQRKYTDEELEECSKLMGIPKEDFPLSIWDTKKRSFKMEKLREKLEEAIEVGKALGINVGFYPSFLLDDIENCYNETLRENGEYFCKYLLTGRVDPQGNLIHCYGIRKSFGNLLEKPFIELWNSDEMRKFRKRLLNNNLLPICETCLHMKKMR